MEVHKGIHTCSDKVAIVPANILKDQVILTVIASCHVPEFRDLSPNGPRKAFETVEEESIGYNAGKHSQCKAT